MNVLVVRSSVKKAVLLVGELLIEGAPRGLRHTDDIGDGGLAVSRPGHTVEHRRQEPFPRRRRAFRPQMRVHAASISLLPCLIPPPRTVTGTPTYHPPPEASTPDEHTCHEWQRDPAARHPPTDGCAGRRRGHLPETLLRSPPPTARFGLHGETARLRPGGRHLRRRARARELFTAGDKVINVQPNLGRILGTGSIFSLEGRQHRARRKLLTPPPLHSKRMKTYEQIVEEEVRTEAATWPNGTEFASMEPMMRITLNVILRAVCGAQGKDLENLRRMIPPMVVTGSRAATFPNLPHALRALDPNHRYRRMHAEYKTYIGDLITKSRNDSRLEERDDILALMLRSTYEDGTGMDDEEIGDELLTMLAAGHETTGTTLAWAFERLRRHPRRPGRTRHRGRRRRHRVPARDHSRDPAQPSRHRLRRPARGRRPPRTRPLAHPAWIQRDGLHRPAPRRQP